MRISSPLLSSGLAIALLAAGVLLAPTFARDSLPSRPGDHPWLTIAQLADKLEATGYRDIEKIEREHGGYEVRATNRTGQRVKLRLNPWTGEEVAPPSRANRHDPRSEGAGSECSQRRCRDDLQKTKPAN